MRSVCTNFTSLRSVKLGCTSAKKMKNFVSHFVLRSVYTNFAKKFHENDYT